MNKEYKVYIASAYDFPEVAGIAIDVWSKSDGLPVGAVEFIEHCENEGNVYSLQGFMTAFNINEEVGMNDWIFITNKY